MVRLLGSLALWLSGSVLLLGCASPPKTTRIQVDDYQAMAAAMSDSLAASEALQGRGPDSPPWVVSIDKVTNLTSDVMSVSEQWSIIEQIRASLPMIELGDTKNISFVLPPERRASLEAQAGVTDASPIDKLQTTHVMTATFRSVTRAVSDGRTELYYCEFELLDLERGAPVWADRFEYKRSARGKIWD